MTLDIVERHLSWCHSKVIWTEKEYGQFQLFIEWKDSSTAMEDGVVHHDHSSQAPLRIFLVKVSDKLHHEIAECVGVGVATVDIEEELAVTCERADEVDASDLDGTCDLIQLASLDPASLLVVGVVDDSLIDVDDSHASMKRSDEL